jgi:hypothetical protein
VGVVCVPGPGATLGRLVGAAGWGEELSALGWGVGVYAVSGAVDGDVVVVPAQRRQVVRVVAAAGSPGDDVVGLEPVAGGTAGDDAA